MKILKVLLKLIKVLLVTVGILFVVYFWNLDQKLLGWVYKQVNLIFDHKKVDILFDNGRAVVHLYHCNSNRTCNYRSDGILA